MITLTLTEQEVIALRQLLHRALLHSGMEVAEAATHFNRRLNESSGISQPKPNGNDAHVSN